MKRWPLKSLLLLALCTACPETWRKGGTIDRAMAKDIEDEQQDRGPPPGCELSVEQWASQCDHAANPMSPG